MKPRKVGGDWKKFFKKKPKLNDVEEVKFLERVGFQVLKPPWQTMTKCDKKPLGIPDDINSPAEYLEHMSYEESPEVMRLVREMLGDDYYI